MWEKTRVDGKRKLRSNAIPTLFSFTKLKTKRKPPAKRCTREPVLSDITQEPSTSTATIDPPLTVVHLNNENLGTDSNIENDMNALKEKLKNYETRFRQMSVKIKKYKVVLRNKNDQLKRAKSSPNEDTKLLHSTFAADQICAMKRKSPHFMRWSNVTVKKALTLKFSCGTSGYEQLLKYNTPLPSLQMKNNLKLISISRYLKDVSKGNYDYDDKQFLSGFLDTVSEKSHKISKEAILPVEVPDPILNMNYGELNSFYNVCGYIINSITINSKICEKCVNSVGSKQSLYFKFTKLTLLKQFNKNCLFFCNESTFVHFLDLEGVFRKYINIVINQNIDLKEFFVDKMLALGVFLHVPNCHSLKNHLVKRFVIFRLKISSKRKQRASQKYASKALYSSM